MIKALNFQKTASFLGAVFLFLNLPVRAQVYEFSFESDPGAPNFGHITLSVPIDVTESLRNLDSKQIKKLFRVYVGDRVPEDPTIPSIAGKYKIESQAVTFIPRFDPPPGISYFALFEVGEAYDLITETKPDRHPERVFHRFEVPELKPISGEAIVSIYPSSDSLPANLLRMYVYFGQPMGLANPHDHVSLLDELGQVVGTPFVEITEGLWNHNRTRLTLFFHPGRVKRGVGPNMTIGAVLTPGNTYQLTFDPEWTDALGRSIGISPPKTFVAKEAVRNLIYPYEWKISLPKSGTSDPMRINMQRPLDHALAKRMIAVKKNTETLDLVTEILADETVMAFSTSVPWKSGTYFLEIDPRLEDLSGNTPFHLFDTETIKGKGSDKKIPEPIRIPFVIE